MPTTAIQDMAGTATAEDGVVFLDGPNGVAVTMTADAAEATGRALVRAADQARSQVFEPD